MRATIKNEKKRKKTCRENLTAFKTASTFLRRHFNDSWSQPGGPLYWTKTLATTSGQGKIIFLQSLWAFERAFVFFSFIYLLFDFSHHKSSYFTKDRVFWSTHCALRFIEVSIKEVKRKMLNAGFRDSWSETNWGSEMMLHFLLFVRSLMA